MHKIPHLTFLQVISMETWIVLRLLHILHMWDWMRNRLHTKSMINRIMDLIFVDMRTFMVRQQ